jgi:hypothetical protein
MIPIRPTALAAENDMGIMTWVVARARAIPSNFRHLILNEAAINWMQPGANYNSVVSAAADQAGGQGFVTEYARSTESLGQVIFPNSDEEFWQTLQAGSLTGAQLVSTLQSMFFGIDGLNDAIASHASPPEGVSETDWLNCTGCYAEGDFSNFDRADFIRDVEESAIAPLRVTRELVESLPFITRLYTTMSDVEMTTDPEFLYNASLGDIDNNHTSTRHLLCDADGSNLSWDVALPQGDVVIGTDLFTWPVTLDDVPANRQIRREDTSGPGTTLVDNRRTISDTLRVNNATNRIEPSTFDRTCGGDGAAAPVLLLASAIAWARRRRSQPSQR